MKKSLLLMTLMLTCLSLHAQFDKGFVRPYDNMRNAPEMMRDHIARDMANRDAKLKVLPNKKWLLDESNWWTNGFVVFKAYYDEDSREIGLSPQLDEPTPDWDPIGVLKVRGSKISSQDGRIRYTIEQLGHYVMLVGRNAQGQPLAAYYMVSNDDFNQGGWIFRLQHVLAGNYTTANGESAVFGPRMEHYTGESYNIDPGAFISFRPEDNFTALSILYGDGRVSRGDPSHPNYDKMPGGGGAGALMGPMMWRVTPTVEGMQVNVVHDEKFVDHLPRVADGSLLTFVQSPYKDLPGRWAVASVMPLTHQILRLLPKQVLKLMRAEIYARHGDTFKDAATQRYFDAQPWYKKSGRKIILTDIERFNYALIKQVEASR